MSPAGRPPAVRPLARLLEEIPAESVPSAAAGLRVRRIVSDAGVVEPGDLFVAVRGHRTDGHYFVAEAVARGAAAVVAERDPGGDIGAPVIRVPDTRRALAALAAAWYGHPARRLRLIGITGSFGKTGTLSMLQEILLRAGLNAGATGSDFVGTRIPGERHEPAVLTTPGPLELHETLARLAAGDGQACILEVTSQGLVQERVHGLRFALGIFTCIAPLEHGDYHGSFRSYVEAKARFFEYLVPGAPIVYPAGERVVRTLVDRADLAPVRCGTGPRAAVRIRRRVLGPTSTRMVLDVARPLPAVDGGTVAPVSLPIELPLLGRMNARNAALAAAAALCLGVAPEAVRAGLATVQPSRRRLQLERRGGFLLLDDTATHPESLCVLFNVVRGIPHRRLRLVAAIRGGRGLELNCRYAGCLAIWARKRPVHELIVTSSDETVDAADRVAPEERDAFLRELQEAGIPHAHHERLDDAIRHALDRIGTSDLLVLIGAQGMHPGADLVRRWTSG